MRSLLQPRRSRKSGVLFVGRPLAMYNEMSLGRARHSRPSWFSATPYAGKRLEDLDDELQEQLVFEPDTAHLFVEGAQIHPQTPPDSDDESEGSSNMAEFERLEKEIEEELAGMRGPSTEAQPSMRGRCTRGRKRRKKLGGGGGCRRVFMASLRLLFSFYISIVLCLRVSVSGVVCVSLPISTQLSLCFSFSRLFLCLSVATLISVSFVLTRHYFHPVSLLPLSTLFLPLSTLFLPSQAAVFVFSVPLLNLFQPYCLYPHSTRLLLGPFVHLAVYLSIPLLIYLVSSLFP